MAHSDHHQHIHRTPDFSRAFVIGIGLNSAFVAAEVVAGLAADSMALLADAGHNLSDILGLALAWAAAAMAKKPASERFTYGLKKAPILAALFNAVLLLVAVGAILLEAARRLFHPEPANGETVMLVAGIGILVNGVTAWLFASGRRQDINIRGAFLHMAADAAVSVGVVIAGALIVYTGWLRVDPVVSIVIAIVILWGTFDLLKQSTWMSLAAVPQGMALQEVEQALAGVVGVEGVHDLHIWPMSTSENALTVHLVVPDRERQQRVLADARTLVEQRFALHHATIQVESVAERGCADC